MLKELVDRLVELGKDTCNPTLLETGSHRKRTFLHDGEVYEYDIDPPLRFPQVLNIRSMAEYISNNSIADFSIWHDATTIYCLLDNADRREWARMELDDSEVYRSLCNRFPAVSDQKALIRALRVEFASYIEPTIVDQFAVVEFTGRETGSGQVQRGKESIGKSIERQIDKTNVLPEQIVFTVPRYDNYGLEQVRFPVKVDVYVDPATCMFTLSVIEGELQRLNHTTQDAIHGIIRAELSSMGLEDEVYYGTS